MSDCALGEVSIRHKSGTISEIMDDSKRSKSAPDNTPSREDRLKQALRANLKRRKTQARERQEPKPKNDAPVDPSDR